MKNYRLIHRISTIIIVLMMLNSAWMCFFSPFMIHSLHHLGFPRYFQIELGIAKIMGASVLILPFAGHQVKEWAYAGFFIMFISGILAHLIVGDPVSMWGSGLLALAVLIVSYRSYHQQRALSVSGRQ